MKTIQQRSRQPNHPLYSYEPPPYKNPLATTKTMSPPSHLTHYCNNNHTDLSQCPEFQMQVRLTTMATEESIMEKAREENRSRRSSGPSWGQPPPYKKPSQRPGPRQEREASRRRSSRSSFVEGRKQQQQGRSWSGGEGPQTLQARLKTPSMSKQLLARLLPQESSRVGHGSSTKAAPPVSNYREGTVA